MKTPPPKRKIAKIPETQPTSTAENEDNPSRVPARRRVDKGIIEAVAALVSRGLTESEACRQLNIRPKTFFNFKSTRKNDARFSELLEKFRSARIEDLITEIESSAKGKGMKQRDWRAAKFLLEVLDRQRFNTDRPIEVNVNNSQPVVSIQIAESIRRAYAADLNDLKPAALASPAPEPKQIENENKSSGSVQ